jgi:hypothetical protein
VIDAVGMEAHGFAIDNGDLDTVKQKVGIGFDRAARFAGDLAVPLRRAGVVPGVYGGMTDKFPPAP